MRSISIDASCLPQSNHLWGGVRSGKLKGYKEVQMRPLARVVFDEAHRQAWSTRSEVAQRINEVNPADAGYVVAAEYLRDSGFEVSVLESGQVSQTNLASADVFVLLHASEDAWEGTTGNGSPKYAPEEIDALVDYVQAGGGLVLFGETEQLKYGNSAADIAARFGIEIQNTTVQDPKNSFKDVATWVVADLVATPELDLTSGASQACFYRTGTLAIRPEAQTRTHVIARTSASANPANSPVLVATTYGAGRVVVVADSDLFGDDSIADFSHSSLWRNLVTWAASSGASGSNRTESWTKSNEHWLSLVEAVEGIRALQQKDGSIREDASDADRARLTELSNQMIAGIRGLIPRFEHQRDHLEVTITDIEKWIDSGFAVPDFLDSLLLFRPDQHREHKLENLVVFPMYTQNGNLDRHFEAVITRTFWPDWIAELERNKYDNPAFVPIEFVDFTAGYDTNSAVLFPETVATRELAKFYWGGIFCDREAARFRRITSSASELLKLSVPADLELMLADQELTKETFVLWDLVHDRAHSHGDLPFDPFMIKQRMPYWMYALEELRCDLTAYRETITLEANGVFLARFVRLAVLFDRLYRFPITGDRVRNYDGLAGQIIFAWLHQQGVLRWTDNKLSLDWTSVDDAIVALCEQVEELYRTGIDKSRLAHWMSAYDFVRSLVAAHPASNWAKGGDALPLGGELKDLVNLILPDEFPLNVFYEALRKKLAPEVAATAGIVG
jgi:hypothetical protein